VLPPLADAHWTRDIHVRVPRTVTPELAELVGYFMGDGSLHAKGLRFCVSNDDLDVVDHLLVLGKELFGLEAAVSLKHGYAEVALHSVRLAMWWDACGFAKHEPQDGHRGKGYVSHVPDAVLYSNDRAVYSAFLRGLFEADGTVTARIPTWVTAKASFADEVQSLLLALGYPTARKHDVSGRGSPLTSLRLLNTSYHTRWLEEVGFIGARKSARVICSEGRQAARQDHIPVTRELVDRLAPVNDHLRRVLLQEVKRGRVSRRVATELYERTRDAELGHLLRFFYDSVSSVDFGDDEFTFDLSVPDNVTYVANGFVSHNTIGLMMDCDTTGVEPDLALTKAKKLVGGGTMFIVNQTIPRALRRLGYSDEQIDAIVGYIDEHKTIIGAPQFDPQDLPVFACSMGDNPIHYMGHVTMMGAVQPFISGAISKTVNMPEDVSVDDVEQLHIDAWKLGIKAIAIYRDNCKVAQPLATQKKASTDDDASELTDQVERIVEHVIVQEPVRQKLPRTRNSKTFSFRVADCRGFATVAEYEDGRPGELFLNVSKQGSTLAGIMDSFAISVSHGLQYGVPLRAFIETFTNRRFEPAGMTDDPDIRIATSLVDYIFRKLAVEYLSYEERAEIGVLTTGERMQPTLPGVEEAVTSNEPMRDELPLADRRPSAAMTPPGPGAMSGGGTHEVVLCHVCGDIMQRAGSCHACPSCGATSGCS
jgi:ribonucleoside-diphosphate reductase alpha chain